MADDAQMDAYVRSLNKMVNNTDELIHRVDGEVVTEAGNISSGLAIKRHNDVIKFGRQVLRERKLEEKIDLIAKALVAHSSISLMSVAVSGGKSFGSTIAKGASLRGI